MKKLFEQISGLLNEWYHDLKVRLIFTISLFVILPIALITFFSTRYLEEQFSRNQDQYLRSTLAIATSEMQQRQNSVRTAALCIAQEVSTPQAVKQKDTKVLEEKLALLRNNFNKVDYAIMLDPDNHIIARSGANIRFNPNDRLGAMNRDVCRTGNPINANEKMPLSDLFAEGSEEFKKFTVELKQGIAGEGEYMQQALCEVTMVPVMDTEDSDKVIACMVLIGICNSDYYFPSYINSKATNGFLVLTVDGVHVSTKSTEGEDRSWIVGHKAGSITSSKADDGTYSGKVYLRGVPHLFIDHPLRNYSGDLVGYISFGLQEDQFSGIVEDNRKQTLFIGILCFVLFAPLIWLMAAQVRQNQKHLELLVRRRTKDLESAVEELKQLNETKNRFLSNITHELRTPLCVIINACDFLKGGYSGTLNEKQYRYVDNASECGSHLLTLINNLLDLTRLRSGKTRARFTRFSVHAFVDTIVNEMRNYRPDAHISMQTFFEPEDFEVTADPQMLRQIIFNLLSNALKFSLPDSRITIRVQKMEESRQMRISIADEGIGIARENLERIFNEFEQIENPMTKKRPGTGLGLPIVKKLAELHHGTISLQSELGKGTEAILLLPLKQDSLFEAGETIQQSI
ncbi:MAG TPA: hypothetical protein DEG55_05185 [Acidaminococcaceae bacterium]|nr:hypothetical protein [Acidaminococcaceae bacterium]